MEWYNVLVLILGALGGTAGLIGLYKAKSEKTTIDITNMEKMLNDALGRYDKLEGQFDEFRTECHSYIEGLRGKIVDLEKRDKEKERRLNSLEKVVNVAWRCKYPQNVQDCPVVQEFEKRHLCDGCENIKK